MRLEKLVEFQNELAVNGTVVPFHKIRDRKNFVVVKTRLANEIALRVSFFEQRDLCVTSALSFMDREPATQVIRQMVAGNAGNSEVRWSNGGQRATIFSKSVKDAAKTVGSIVNAIGRAN